MSGHRRGTNLPRMGDFNRSVILEAVRRRPEGLSRTELVAATGLSAQTVTNITRRLLDDAFIEEAGRTIAGPGKPRTTLRLNAESRLSVGVHLDPAVMTVVLLDLSGRVLARVTRRTPTGDPQQIIQTMADAVDDLLAQSGRSRGRVAGIGLAVPGPLDEDRGAVIDPPKLSQWHRVPLRDALAEATGLPVMIEKDTAAAAVGQVWMGDDAPGASFVFVYLGIGIGTAVVVDGEVIRGTTGNAGEVGHVIVDPDGPLCRCGMRGCVDVVCTPQAIVERAERAGVFPRAAGTADPAAVDDRFTQLTVLAEAGQAAAVSVVDAAAEHLAVLIATVTNALDVDRVVLGGPFWSRVAERYLARLPTLVDRRSAARAVRALPVVGTVVGDDVGAVGAACVVLDHVLSPRASSLLLQR